MISSRPIEKTDKALLTESLARDEYHKGTTADFFLPKLPDGSSDPRFACNVYEDECGPVMFVRGTKALRLDIQFVNNSDAERNSVVLLGDFSRFIDQARENGFTELVFCSSSPALRAFCRRRFKFKEERDELRLYL